MLEKCQGLGVSISRDHRAASLQRRVGTSLSCCMLAFPDGSVHGNMCTQAERTVRVLLHSHCCQGLQRLSVESELPMELCPCLDGTGRLQNFPSSLPRPPNVPCLTVLPPRGCIPPAVLTHRTLILIFSAP